MQELESQYISKYSQLSAKGHSHKPTALLADTF